MDLYWEYQCQDGGFLLLTREGARDAYLRDIPTYDKRRHMKRKQDATAYAEGLADADALVRYTDARAEIDRIHAKAVRMQSAIVEYYRWKTGDDSITESEILDEVMGHAPLLLPNAPNHGGASAPPVD